MKRLFQTVSEKNVSRTDHFARADAVISVPEAFFQSPTAIESLNIISNFIVSLFKTECVRIIN